MGYMIGTLVKCYGSFTDDENHVEPGSVTFTVKRPDGSVDAFVFGIHPEIIQERVGVYRVDVNASQVGKYVCRYESSGEYQGAQEWSFTVDGSAI